ncbi:MAG: hypothetical protein QXW94_03025 [Desulfurococcaceae archaeon]
MEEKVLYAWIVFGIYIAITLLMGLKYYGRIKRLSDFLVAGRSLGLCLRTALY